MRTCLDRFIDIQMKEKRLNIFRLSESLLKGFNECLDLRCLVTALLPVNYGNRQHSQREYKNSFMRELLKYYIMFVL